MTELSSHLTVSTDKTNAEWSRAFSTWINTRPENTGRAYRSAWKALLVHCGKTPREISREDVSSWVEAMGAAGLSAATIAQRLAAISSFFTFLGRSYGIKTENPASGTTLRPKTDLYSGSRFLNSDDVRVLLAMINRYTLRGSRDYALFLTYLFTGRRNSEIRKLQWGDIEQSGGKVFYHWAGKGKARRDELPRPCFDAIVYHLQLAGRFETMQPDDYIFCPIGHGAENLPNFRQGGETAPLSMHQVEDLLRTYTRRAGIASRLRVHDLRHTAAMLRRQAGDDILRISEFLGHSNLAITQVYLHRIEGSEDTSWRTVGELLGITDQNEIHAHTVAQKHGRRHWK